MSYKLLTFLLSLVISIAGATILSVFGKYLLAIPLIIGSIIFIILIINEFKVNTKKLTYMLDSFENNDSTFRYYDKWGDKYNKLYNATINKINIILSNEKKMAVENELYFKMVMNNVITGIITIDENGNICDTNNKALELLGLNVLTHITQFKYVDEKLFEYLNSSNFSMGDSKWSFFDKNRGMVYISLKISYINVKGKSLRIVVINDIGQELDEKEQESWTRLIRVLTHEIMNSVTPLSSLSSTLSMKISSSEVLNKTLSAELKSGLDVINSTSQGLISFINSYRSLTIIPILNKKVILVKDLIQRVLILMCEDFSKLSIVPRITYSDPSLMIYVDEHLITQVFINLLHNALYALTDVDRAPQICISTRIDQITEDIIVEISNNGKPIPKEEFDSVFIPFYTTKESGSGIGLSLSRQIMFKHNGSLKLKKSDEFETVFVMIFR